MRQMGITALYPKANTSRPGKRHKIYPYLLRGLEIDRPNQVWATDICYVPMARGFVYVVAIMDWYSRKVLAWRVANTMDADFCVEALEEALCRYGTPEIFNTDQGAQFTSEAFTGALKAAGIRISMLELLRRGTCSRRRGACPSPSPTSRRTPARRSR